MIDRLIRAGFHFSNDDFVLQFWHDLGLVHEWQDNRRQAQLLAMMFGGGKEKDASE